MTALTDAGRRTLGVGGGSSGAPERNASGMAALVVFVVLLYCIPSALIFKPLGAAGTPAQVVAFLILGWWAFSQVLPQVRTGPRNPIVWLLTTYAVVVLASFVAGMSRIVTPVESNAALRSLITLGAWCGVVLVMTSVVSSREDAFRICRTVATCAAIIAGLGYVQFFFGVDIAGWIRVPGLSANEAFGSLIDRSGFRRVTGTTAHPIEFGVVIAALLPIVLHCARYGRSPSERRWWWIVAAAMAEVLPMAVARSGVIGGIVVFLVIFPTWPRELRRRILAVAVVGVVAMVVIVPGLLGTIRSLFLNVGNDNSIQGRTDDYPWIEMWVHQHPILGRGSGTFVLGYRILDNQYLGSLVETGILGLLALLALVFGAVVVASMLRSRSRDDETRDFAQALVAGLLVIGVCSVTFDSFSFPMCSGTLVLLIGLTGWLWRSQGGLRLGIRPDVQRRLSRAAVAVVAAVMILAWSVAGLSLLRLERGWTVGATVTLTTPQSDPSSIYAISDTGSLVSVLHDWMYSDEARAEVAKSAVGDYGVAVGQGSLERGTDQGGHGPSLTFEAEAPTAVQAQSLMSVVLSEAGLALSRWQSELGVPTVQWSAISSVTQLPTPVAGRPKYALLAFLLLTAVLVRLAFVAGIGGHLRSFVRWTNRLLPDWEDGVSAP